MRSAGYHWKRPSRPWQRQRWRRICRDAGRRCRQPGASQPLNHILRTHSWAGRLYPDDALDALLRGRRMCPVPRSQRQNSCESRLCRPTSRRRFTCQFFDLGWRRITPGVPSRRVSAGDHPGAHARRAASGIPHCAASLRTLVIEQAVARSGRLSRNAWTSHTPRWRGLWLKASVCPCRGKSSRWKSTRSSAA